MSVVKDSLLHLHNQHRANHGKRALAINSTLNQGAQYLANQMAKYKWKSSAFGDNHRRPNGQSFGNWWDSTYRGTWVCCRKTYIAENLGWGWSRSVDVFGPMGSHGGSGNQWTTSTSHHGYLSSATYRKVGFGVATDSNGYYYWVAHFSS